MDTSMHDISNLNLIYPGYIILHVSIMDICAVHISIMYKQSGYIRNGYIPLNGYIKMMQKVHSLLPCKPGHQSNNIYWESVFVCPPSLSPPHRVNELRGVTPTKLAPLRHMWLR